MIELRNEIEQRGLTSGGRQLMQPAFHADSRAGLAFIADVTLARVVVANKDGRQARLRLVLLGKLRYRHRYLGLHCLREFRAVEYCCHRSSSMRVHVHYS